MSVRREKIFSLTGVNALNKSLDELIALFHKVLEQKMHGLCFSPYLADQKPGSQLSEDQIRRRIEVIAPYTNWIRSFSCTEGNELIPRIAHEFGIKTLVGAWLGKDPEINAREVAGLIQIAKEGYVDIAAVGNEVMYRNDLTEDELIRTIESTKNEIPNVPVGYVDAYYEFENRPALTDSCDVVLANCYPFWEGCQIDYATLYMKDMYRRAQRAGKGKKVIITETGWPNTGQSFHGAIPSQEGAIRYFLDAQQWSKEEEIDLFYFSSFDETWKTSMEGDVRAYWGLWDKDRQLKYQQTR